LRGRIITGANAFVIVTGPAPRRFRAHAAETDDAEFHAFTVRNVRAVLARADHDRRIVRVVPHRLELIPSRLRRGG